MMCFVGSFLSTVVKISFGPGALLLGSFLIRFFYLLRSAFQRGIRAFVCREIDCRFRDR